MWGAEWKFHNIFSVEDTLPLTVIRKDSEEIIEGITSVNNRRK